MYTKPDFLILLLILFFFKPVFLFAQVSEQESDPIVPVDEVTGMIIYRDVIETEGSKEELFNRAISWISDNYKNAASVTSRRDFESGIIEGDHRFKIYSTTEDSTSVELGTILYNFTLEFKNGRYRYTYTDFAMKGASRIPLERWLDNEDPLCGEHNFRNLRKVDAYMTELLNSLKEGMIPPVEVEDDDW